MCCDDYVCAVSLLTVSVFDNLNIYNISDCIVLYTNGLVGFVVS